MAEPVRISLRVLVLLALAAAHVSAEPIALIGATVIDATGAPPRPDTVVLIEAERILAVGRRGELEVPADATRIDARGRFLIPGLWDMHVHLWNDEPAERVMLMLIANGITGVREMGGSPSQFERVRGWRRAIEDGFMLGPRILAAGLVLDAPQEEMPLGHTAIADADEMARRVAELRALGADLVKVHDRLTREAYDGAIEAARVHDLPVEGHVPLAVPAAQASDVGQRSMEHLSGLLLACARDESVRRRRLLAGSGESEDVAPLLERLRADAELLDAFDASRADALIARFARNGTWQVPTLTLLETFSRLGDGDPPGGRGLARIPPALRPIWEGARRSLFTGHTPEDATLGRRLFEKQLALVRAMRRAGVPLLAGTDMTVPYLFFSLHEELALLVRAGLTPLEALQAATSRAAEYRGVAGSQGTVAPSQLADLVLLDADPLADITNTRSVSGVVLRGRYLSKASLDERIARLDTAAQLGAKVEDLEAAPFPTTDDGLETKGAGESGGEPR